MTRERSPRHIKVETEHNPESDVWVVSVPGSQAVRTISGHGDRIAFDVDKNGKLVGVRVQKISLGLNAQELRDGIRYK